MLSSWAMHHRAAMAGITGMAFSLAFGAWLIPALKRRQIVEDVSKPDAAKLDQLHAAKKNTPTMGGLMILVAVLASTMLCADLHNLYVRLALFVTAALGVVGLTDDALKLRYKRTRQGPRGLNKRRKLILQSLIGLVVGWLLWRGLGDAPHAARMYVPFLCEAGADFGPAIIPWVAFVILAASNSLNISDGLDGLASGCTLITTPALALVVAGAGHAAWAGRFHLAYAPGVGELVVALAALIGAAAGFLWYNAHPAAIFMGDTGSLPIGGLLGYVAASAKQEILFIVIGAVFVFEMASVVLQVISFKTTGKRIFKIAPYHHSLEYRGWHENKVTMRLWILAALAASAGLGILALP